MAIIWNKIHLRSDTKSTKPRTGSLKKGKASVGSPSAALVLGDGFVQENVSVVKATITYRCIWIFCASDSISLVREEIAIHL